jgi:DNA-binding Lrp family transcriptional regulator
MPCWTMKRWSITRSVIDIWCLKTADMAGFAVRHPDQPSLDGKRRWRWVTRSQAQRIARHCPGRTGRPASRLRVRRHRLPSAIRERSEPSTLRERSEPSTLPELQKIKVTAMVTAIVFVKAEVARIPEVAEEIAALNGVSEVYSVTGTIDLIAMIRVANHDQVAEVVADRLNKVPGVVSTETHIAFRAYSAHDLEAAFSLGG